MNNLISLILNLLVPTERESTRDRLNSLGFISQDIWAAWNSELTEYDANLSLVVARQKHLIDEILEDCRGELSSEKSLQIISPAVALLNNYLSSKWFDVDKIREKIFLDFGAGRYSPLAASMILFANGFKKCFVYEPAIIDVDLAAASVRNTCIHTLLNPHRFNFSGIKNDELKKRIASLDLENIEQKIHKLNNGESSIVSFGKIFLTNQISELQQSDLILSNSVLEHVENLQDILKALYCLMTNTSVAIHTVDFSDHRAITNKNVNLYEMYYDGTLEDINGLRPSEMEKMFYDAGFDSLRINRLNAPQSMALRRADLIDKFQNFSDVDLMTWVNSYIHRKKRIPEGSRPSTVTVCLDNASDTKSML
jgi:hypothetical protein